jgi:predicted ATP-grasp superfamily ATP-dependent carboligase
VTSSPAYVLDLSPNGLGAVRILARAGVAVRGFDCDPAREGFRSRYGRPRLCPDPTVDPGGLVEFLRGMVRAERRPPFLLPCNDKFAEFVSVRRSELEPDFVFVLSSPDLFEALLDKEGTYELAAGTGVAVPRTANVLAGPGNAGRSIPDGFPFPALLKPAMTYTLWGLTRGKVLVVRNPVEAGRALASLPAGAAFALQEVIPGGDDRLIFYNTYRDRSGRALAEFVSRKIRQYPPGFGTSTLFESCVDEEVLETGRRLFDGIDHRGLGSAEFKRDARDGRLKLIEVNPRLWLFHPLSVPAGVDFVLTAYRDATGQPVPPQTQAARTVKWLLLLRDLAVSLFYWRDGRLAIRDWLASYRGPIVKALWSVDDPLPFLWSLWRVAGKAARRASGRFGRTAGPAVPELSWAEQMETLSPRSGTASVAVPPRS